MTWTKEEQENRDSYYAKTLDEFENCKDDIQDWIVDWVYFLISRIAELDRAAVQLTQQKTEFFAEFERLRSRAEQAETIASDAKTQNERLVKRIAELERKETLAISHYFDEAKNSEKNRR